MTVHVQVLFDTPQQEIASLLRNRLAQCTSASIVVGFMTVEGIEAIAASFRAHPAKLARLVVGAGTYRSFEALDQLISIGVGVDRLRLHLGHSRPTAGGARHPFYRYHPMLHSKVYLLEMMDGTVIAFIGSHNLTGFALLGLNGEASVLLEGRAGEPEFASIRQHIDESAAQAIPYDPAMKEAYSWWTTQLFDGLRDKTNDIPRDAESQKTIVVITVSANAPIPQKGDIRFFAVWSGEKQYQAGRLRSSFPASR
jgi:HKD family nuclease